MKTIFAMNGSLGGILSLGVLTTQIALAQNTLQIRGVHVTDEQAILLN